MKELLKHIILALTILNVPTFGLASINPSVGSLSAAMLVVALALYYFFIKKNKPLIALLVLGILYYSISGFNFSGPPNVFIKDIFRYFLFIISVTEVAKNTTNAEACFYLLIGAGSVIVNALIFSDDYGRYAGFYLNPNRAGLICILGFAFTYRLTNKKYRIIAQLLFTLAGIATLSRYFLLLLVLINITSLFANRKNIAGLFIGAIGLVIIINTPAFELNKERFDALDSFFSEGEVKTTTVTRESRQETWALYTDVIVNNVLIGNGYGSMQGQQADTVGIKVGVHNSYLMVVGEAGILPFLMMILFYASLAIKSLLKFRTNPEYLYLSLIITSYLLVSHNYFYNYIILFFSIWLFAKVTMDTEEKVDNLENE
ncbi:O-antigen ligase family protein [Oceanihabitans sediminis]|uniref:O-antigen ligase family protein n=1 Tax=Oceanihabitans sediminis TaxID=1812012 RepID=UPI00299D2BA1|nr:O-antigen ligase family protein [Oceanihabitans sediminis]MDX1773615.1 O-antigen ligase family protein [Oceanihabitans sediminis]